MAPIIRLTALALVFAAAFTNASPVLAPRDPNAPAPAFENYAYASAIEPRAIKLATTKIVLNCKVKGNIAITFDDGPNVYTGKLLDWLEKHKSKPKVTFFINGNNYLNIKEKTGGDLVKRAYKLGHQIASHTLHHQNLPELHKQVLEKSTNLTPVKALEAAGNAVLLEMTARKSTNMRGVVLLTQCDQVSVRSNGFS